MTISGSEARSIGIHDLEKDEEIERLKKRVEELEDALLYATEGEENPTVAYTNCIEGGKERRAMIEGIDAAILSKGRPQ